MSDENALLAAIVTHRFDYTPRLIYADWLDENDRGKEAKMVRRPIATGQLSYKSGRRAWSERLTALFSGVVPKSWLVHPISYPLLRRDHYPNAAADDWYDMICDELPGGYTKPYTAPFVGVGVKYGFVEAVILNRAQISRLRAMAAAQPITRVLVTGTNYAWRIGEHRRFGLMFDTTRGTTANLNRRVYSYLSVKPAEQWHEYRRYRFYEYESQTAAKMALSDALVAWATHTQHESDRTFL